MNVQILEQSPLHHPSPSTVGERIVGTRQSSAYCDTENY